LIGKNGAGKTTLMKILNGVIAKDSGKIVLDGRDIVINSVQQAQDYGISMVYQDLNIFPHLTVAENIFVNRFAQNGMVNYGVIQIEKMMQEAQEILERLNFHIDARFRMSQLGLGQQQMVEIVRAISQKARILILDEPTAALNEQEVRNFLGVLREIQQLGMTIIYISHRLKEIVEIAQNITILRDGIHVLTLPVDQIGENDVIKLMVGKEALERYPKLMIPTQKELFKVENLSMTNVLTDISFKLHESEILGIAGLAGSGRSALINAIFGLGATVKGKIFLRQQEVRLKSPKQAIEHGFVYLAEDRVRMGLFNNLSFERNIVSSNLQRITSKGLIQSKKQTQIAQGLVKRLGIQLIHFKQKVSALSGGNQQKTLLAKGLYTGGLIYLLDEPTKGLDIASKVDFYNITNSLICAGSGVIMISSDLAELIGMCHRILVIHKGKIVGELSGKDMSEEKIFRLASGRE
jgi:ABC-type sugar transport system ATPase subunit